MKKELNKEELSSIQKFVSKDFVKNDYSSLIPSNDFERLEEFRKYLTEKMKDMLDKNYNLLINTCLLYTSPSPRDRTRSRMPSSA